MNEYSGVLIVFSNSVARITFFGKFGPETSKCFVWNETRNQREFGGADSEIDNFFLNSVPKIPFSGEFSLRNF